MEAALQEPREYNRFSQPVPRTFNVSIVALVLQHFFKEYMYVEALSRGEDANYGVCHDPRCLCSETQRSCRVIICQLCLTILAYYAYMDSMNLFCEQVYLVAK